MRAIVYTTPGDANVLRLAEVPAPTLGPSELRIGVRTTAVNRADILQRRGLYPPPPGASLILGLECAGEVLEVGTEVQGFTKGERVMALLAGGGYAEEAVVDARCVLRPPSTFSDAEAGGFMETFVTAFMNLFVSGEVHQGDTVLVHGGGSGVGTAALSLARASGVRVFVTAGSAAKCARCKDLGAALAINYRTEDFAAVVRAETGGQGVDLVLDCIGAPYLAANLASLKPGGRLALIGLQGGARGEIDLAPLLSKRLRLMGSTLRNQSAEAKGRLIDTLAKRFKDELAQGALRPVVHAEFPLHEAARAHRMVEAGEHFGKVILRVS